MYVEKTQLWTNVDLFEVKLLIKIVHLFESVLIRCEHIVIREEYVDLVWKRGAPFVEPADILGSGASKEVEPDKPSLSCNGIQVSRFGHTNNLLALAQIHRADISSNRTATASSIREPVSSCVETIDTLPHERSLSMTSADD